MVLTPTQKRALQLLIALIWLSCIIQWGQYWHNQSAVYDFSEYQNRFLERADSLKKAEISPRTLIPAPLVGKPPKLSEQKPKGFPVNVNLAKEAELCTLPGIGPTRARLIIAHREQFGPFRNARQLLRIKGIGAKTLERLSDKISF